MKLMNSTLIVYCGYTRTKTIDRLVTEVGTRLLHEGHEKPFTFVSGDYHCLSTEMGFLSATNLKQSRS